MTGVTDDRPPREREEKEDVRPDIWVGYGRLLKLFRERAAMTQAQLAEALEYSVELVGSIEQGRRPAKATFTERAEETLDSGGALRVLQDQVDLAKLPGFFQNFAALEAEAASRFSWDPLLVPGLVQTEDYARALFAGHCPSLDDEGVEEQVEARVARQRLLTRAPQVELSFIVGEAALRTAVGGRAAMREQLRHLLGIGAQDNVQIQVMPAAGDFHIGLNGPMVLLETMEYRRLCYFESQGIGVLVTEPGKVSAFGLRYGKLRSRALNTDESARFIESLVEET